MKKVLALSVLIAAVSVPVFADTVFQLDVGGGPGTLFLGPFIPCVGVDTNIQGAWYSPMSGIGGGFHANAGVFFMPFGIPVISLSIGGDFVLASRTNKGLWNIGAGVRMSPPYGIPSFYVTTGYQWAFGNSNHRFALKPGISVGMALDEASDGAGFGLSVRPSVSLSLNYSFNNAKTHGR